MILTHDIESEKYNGTIKFIKSPLHFEKCSNEEIKEAPLLGEHTDEILSDLLGYNKN